MGIQLARYKTLAFSLSAGIVGLAGALYAHKLRFISPEQFSISQSIDLLLLVVVGGLGSVQGAFFGAVFIITMPQLISLAKDFLPPAVGQAAGLQAVVFGAVLVIPLECERCASYDARGATDTCLILPRPFLSLIQPIVQRLINLLHILALCFRHGCPLLVWVRGGIRTHNPHPRECILIITPMCNRFFYA